jgi:hypothetical protein
MPATARSQESGAPVFSQVRQAYFGHRVTITRIFEFGVADRQLVALVSDRGPRGDDGGMGGTLGQDQRAAHRDRLAACRSRLSWPKSLQVWSPCRGRARPLLILHRCAAAIARVSRRVADAQESWAGAGGSPSRERMVRAHWVALGRTMLRGSTCDHCSPSSRVESCVADRRIIPSSIGGRHGGAMLRMDGTPPLPSASSSGRCRCRPTTATSRDRRASCWKHTYFSCLPSAGRTEHVDRAAVGIGTVRLLHQRGETVHLLSVMRSTT